ncbi:glucosamine--fructose-6-phosphate aminotransferase (isomerizing) [Chryseobacterium bernardetii]|jgi:glucosamine--fructose-6-phosphate aminotransferase (isomerizing)|uniref:Glutamine--fructose-6-phosphate aminotransferase [isomerizing] n=3 Tax=Chryseobacterium TaxID=59732 RepID=A0A543E9I5_9FLAO|nr:MULTISPECIES: glutamine--fructose-6-phosphate transaminase (isomerizing) [Chryseobacterium]MDR6371845.1 glucosamine--fructose-6-phosphate aminotransferase (isomerizing) [Chryseobacterium vietnamense]MDR6443333.1 glucosamine--fructose-6-phosphate aminotransferase (isomerizing) [Chryseobacterium bernardetii]MDR6460812.1 glucosamine--fructose-6-phosphate aminotransferase (isomerizing) [Chryseobacterium vietnamense]MDR6488508.1 glucosamine--fructose-6-phosphate aminotransferase (isomerizing) [Ch
MCGIVGYTGFQDAYEIVINGLRRLEYRGYDSAGIVLEGPGNKLEVEKTKGKVEDLVNISKELKGKAKIGMGHTRWATHGVPSDRNSHPHLSNNGKIAIVHNGIIENYDTIKTMLTEKGFTFKSETDTEVLVNLIQYFMDLNPDIDFPTAVRYALNEVYGAYAITALHEDYPGVLVVGRLGSPLAIGIGDKEYFIASDASPFVEFTKEAIYLEEGHMATISLENGVDIRTISENSKIEPEIQELKLSLEQIEKGGYEHFMLKEIFEQPKSVHDTMRGRLLVDEGVIKMAGIWDHVERFKNANRIIIIACGTSWHAGLIGEYLIEEYARIPVEVEYASEFRYRNPIITDKDVVIAISQSGETADTMAALKLAKEKGAFIYGICNVVDSSIARITDAGSYTHAGPEIGVASTKAFTAQLTILTLIAFKLGKHNGNLGNAEFMSLIAELDAIPKKIEEVLNTTHELTQNIAKDFVKATNFLYLGRGYNYPAALEGALKLKEISYIHAEGYPAAEMKHGPIALIDENMPIVIIAPRKGHYDKIVSNVQEIKARKGKIIAVVNKGDRQVSEMADYVIEIPETSECFSPIVASVPLQLLAYYIAVYRGANVDQPRNLAKSVTVE